MGAGHRKSTGSMLLLTLANGIYDSHTLYDDDGNLCKDIAPAISHSSGKCTSTFLVKHKHVAQGLYAP